MIDITVVSRQGSPCVGVSARFGEDGGTIGRADTNTLMLSDPDRTVSRVHAQVAFRDGGYVVVDRGSNPLQLNGRPVGSGNEAPLKPGDRLLIGSFELVVSQPVGAGGGSSGLETAALPPGTASAADDDPFAGLLDGLVSPPAAAPAAVPAPSPVDPTAGLFSDPLAGPTPAATGDDPFAGLLGSSAAPAVPAASRADDFSDLVAPAQGVGAESIDALFGLGVPLANDPLATSPLDDPLVQPNTAAAQDPLAALSRQAPLRPDARSDHLPIDAFGFVPPATSVSSPGPAPTPPEPRSPVVLPPSPGGVPGAPAIDPFAGLDDLVVPPADAKAASPAVAVPTMPVPEPHTQQPAHPSPAAQAPVAAAHPSALVREQRHATAPQAGAAPAGSAEDDELLTAFLRGLGPLQQPVEVLTPGLMERIGELLRASTEGTLQLLIARQEIKREVRAEVTMIAAQANNPLKFSPTVEVALAHLLGPGMRGFMPAEAAMRDAYQDLRAHEFGVMVGMHAALEHVIRQFAPDVLEQNIAAKSRLDAIFSANRKAKLWDQFVKLYADIAREAEDDFHALFGKAFLKAYEEQMTRMKDDHRG